MKSYSIPMSERIRLLTVLSSLRYDENFLVGFALFRCQIGLCRYKIMSKTRWLHRSIIIIANIQVD